MTTINLSRIQLVLGKYQPVGANAFNKAEDARAEKEPGYVPQYATEAKAFYAFDLTDVPSKFLLDCFENGLKIAIGPWARANMPTILAAIEHPMETKLAPDKKSYAVVPIPVAAILAEERERTPRTVDPITKAANAAVKADSELASAIAKGDWKRVAEISMLKAGGAPKPGLQQAENFNRLGSEAYEGEADPPNRAEMEVLNEATAEV